MPNLGLIMKKHPEVYDPSEDTMLLATNLKVDKNDRVLEIGIGSGYVSLVAAQCAKNVVGTDINPNAVELAKLNAKLNGMTNVEFVLGDLFSPLKGTFTLILMNPPYLKKVDGLKHRHLDDSWNGGENGRAVTDRFLDEVDGYLETTGRILMIQSSLSDYEKTIKVLSERDYMVRIVDQEKLFFETLYLIEAHKH